MQKKNISKNLRFGYPSLLLLHKTKVDKGLRKVLFQDKRILKVLEEISHNLCLGHIRLSKAEKDKLKRYKKQLQLLSDKGKTDQKYKVLTSKVGGAALTSLLPIVLTALKPWLGQ